MRKLVVTSVALCAAILFGADARAQAPAPYGEALNIETAKKAAAAAADESKKNNWAMCIAVVAPSGDLVYFERMENTQYASMDIAIGKARAAATYRRPTRVFADAINKGSPATATLPGVFASPGGLPIMVDGKVTGAVGVSGVTGDQDEQCAKAGTGG